jgi:FSR family fosmidomycin resistance protein-like MFS transporter
MANIENGLSRPGKYFRYLTAFGFTHFLIDASCCFILLGSTDSGKELMTYIILYNILAFGLQLPLGLLSDYLNKPVLFAFLGCLIVCPAFFLYLYPLTATIFAGIGNALFHVGGGTVSLNLKPGKATMPGIFIAPGGLGLFVGTILARFDLYPGFILVVFLLIMGFVLLLFKQPDILRKSKRIIPEELLIVSIILLLITICIRSGVGLYINYPWKTEKVLAIIFIFAVALGKGTGGYLSDRFGWIIITVGGLAASAFFLFFGTQYIFAGIAGIFLFNISMPVTLTAISNLLPGRPGFSFGLTTMALLAGSIPKLVEKDYFIKSDGQVSILVAISVVTLLIGLLLYQRHIRKARVPKASLWENDM